MNLAWWLHEAAQQFADNVALINPHTDERFTYRELDDRTARISAALVRAGVGEDDVVATLMSDDEWHFCVFFASMRVGGVFSGLNRTLNFDKHKADIDRLGARTIIVSGEFVDRAKALKEVTGLETIIVHGEDSDGLPKLTELIADVEPFAQIVPRRADDLCAVNFTGGTSGVSKGVMFTHGKLELSARASKVFSGNTSTDLNLSVISLFHSGGIIDAMRWTMAGGTNILIGTWNVETFVKAIETYSPTFIMAIIPTMVRDWMRHPRFESLNLNGMRIIVSGEMVPLGMRPALRARGMRVTTIYGLTETMPWAVLGAPFVWGMDLEFPELSVGKPIPELTEVVLKDPTGSGELITTPGELGEICIRGGVTTLGYFNDPERTAAAFDDDGWLHTRDLGWVDEDGWYYVRGRVDDIINIGGEKLSLIEVEDVLKECPLLIDVGCTEVAHERFGSVPAAVVALREGVEAEDIARVIDEYVLQNLERWKRPRLYAIVDEVPRTHPKRTKDIAAMRRLLDAVRLADDGRIITLEQWQADHRVAATGSSVLN